jgi:hypothetical protein
VFAALVNQDAMRLRHIVIIVRIYNIFPHFFTKGTIIEKKIIEHKMCVLIFYTNSV